MNSKNWLFANTPCALIGMVHLLPLPGSPWYGGSIQAILDAAMKDAEALVAGGCHGFIVENMADAPYVKGCVAHETAAAFTLLASHLCTLPVTVGIQVLAGANEQAMAIASVVGADFIRAEGFAYAHVADEGWIDACAGPLLRQRTALGSKVQVWADIQKKHSSHAISADLDITQWAHGAAFCGADAVVVTGKATGRETELSDVVSAKNGGLPVVVGSGVSPSTVTDLTEAADALIVGSWLKEEGQWRNAVSKERVERLATLMRQVHG